MKEIEELARELLPLLPPQVATPFDMMAYARKVARHVLIREAKARLKELTSFPEGNLEAKEKMGLYDRIAEITHQLNELEVSDGKE